MKSVQNIIIYYFIKLLIVTEGEIDIGCKTKDSTGCIECKTDYDLWNKKCYLNIIGCEQYNDDGCTKCDTGYDL